MKKYTFEFLSIFIAVIAAFALNNWNDNRRDNRAESRILSEISRGLDKDIVDVKLNVKGHEQGIKACEYWRKIITAQENNLDSLRQYYFLLTRDFLSIQNTSGYETLKSKGLELIKNDSLRSQIIALYEYDYQTLRKLEEEYNELQFQENYFQEINKLVAPQFEFNSKGNISGMVLPLNITEAERNILLSYLWKIRKNREFILQSYDEVQDKIDQLSLEIDKQLKS
ncbi:hypothetical protein LX77_02693 [Gelidibacter algens]|uniref:Uncharacterized protein n=1 Tax=Gelidibacter algens TaxID=49280 RepID=A0A1A7R6Q9_9FLAO|nr:hypothetical protein [Gelidibacter algens]OBX27183.1 hypothetical protein A9996_00170 [Gelidibacter algens]RAJ22035.1 hypothetical protein LX77_02693 [Gelidibacter algens]